jgi:hypothetical protein
MARRSSCSEGLAKQQDPTDEAKHSPGPAGRRLWPATVKSGGSLASRLMVMLEMDASGRRGSSPI